MAAHKLYKVSNIWSWFTKKTDEFRVATCTICEGNYSYKSTTSNLKIHLIKQHKDVLEAELKDQSSDEDEEYTKISDSTWKHYDILDSDKYLATCKHCDAEVPYESISELTKHLITHDDVALTDDEVLDEKQTGYSTVWNYFKRVRDGVICLICRKLIKHKGTSSLNKHLAKDHKDIKLDEDDTNKLIISTNGNLYEIETEQANDDKDPTTTETIYLQDLEETLNRFTKKEKRKTFGSHFESPRKKVKHIEIESSDDEPLRRKDDSLKLFTKYLLSLMRELPKNVSERLQADFIRQVITAKSEITDNVGNNDAVIANDNAVVNNVVVENNVDK